MSRKGHRHLTASQRRTSYSVASALEYARAKAAQALIRFESERAALAESKPAGRFRRPEMAATCLIDWHTMDRIGLLGCIVFYFGQDRPAAATGDAPTICG